MAVAAGAVLLVFSIWWWYFEHPSEEGLRMSRRVSFIWGYGHYLVLGSVGALGAGLQLAAASSHGVAGRAPATTAGLAVAVPVAVYLVVTGALQGRLSSQPTGLLVIVSVAAALVVILGALASELGVGVATLLMGVVVGLVLFDVLRSEPDVAATG